MATSPNKGLPPDPQGGVESLGGYTPGKTSDAPVMRWKVEGTAIALQGPFSYSISLDTCDTLEKVVDWILHLAEKSWVTTELIESFIELAIDTNKIPFRRGIA